MSYSGLAEARDALVAALEAASASVPPAHRFRVVTELADSIDPPAAILLPPTLTWEGPGPDPHTAAWTVALVVTPGDYLVGQLFELLPEVTSSLDNMVDCVMQTAEPDIFRTGGTELPGYFLRVEVDL